MVATIAAFILITMLAAAAAFRFTRPHVEYAFDDQPDLPISFGHDMAWVAVRTCDTQSVVRALGLVDAKPANWRTGTSAIYEPALRATAVFVSPPVGEWTLIAGLSLPHPVEAPFVDKCRPLLRRLAHVFGDVQYFANDTVVDLHAWARVEAGQLKRGYAVIDTNVVWCEGTPGRDERALGLAHFEIRGVENRTGDIGGGLLMHPTGQQVLKLARQWSVDPTQLSRRPRGDNAPGVGVIGQAPATWKVERIADLPAAA